MTTDTNSYPLRITGEPASELNRGLWLVKWLLIIPHLLLLIPLWVAYLAATVVAFVAILITGRYPRALFDFNVGVMRWSWRVGYYSYGALATDEYPPFTLQDVPDYPARLELEYPETLSRGLVLVKWWLLAIPHYVIVAAFMGQSGLVSILVLFAAVALLFTGRYPRALHDFVMGMNRWAYRVFAYAFLMTDTYPPFQLDMDSTDRSTSTRASLSPVPAPSA